MSVNETDIARDNNYSGAAFQADAAMNEDVRPMDQTPSDDAVKPSDQTDYRSVDNGMTSIGATGENADTAILGVTDTPGVRTGSDINAPGVELAGRTQQGPDAEEIVEGESDPISGDNADDKIGGGFINDPANR